MVSAHAQKMLKLKSAEYNNKKALHNNSNCTAPNSVTGVSKVANKKVYLCFFSWEHKLQGYFGVVWVVEIVEVGVQKRREKNEAEHRKLKDIFCWNILKELLLFC